MTVFWAVTVFCVHITLILNSVESWYLFTSYTVFYSFI